MVVATNRTNHNQTTTNAKPKRVDYITSSIGFALPLKFFRSDLNFPSKLKTTTLMMEMWSLVALLDIVFAII